MSSIKYSLDKETNIASIIMDCPGPVNTIGLDFLGDLERAIIYAKRDQPKGVIISSAKAKSFLDGANLQEIMTDATPRMIRVVIDRFQDACADLAKAPFPVVGVLKGQTALGGGFELLLWACDHIFTTKNSKMGLPEVNVGLFPAGGGTQTLRRLVGFPEAVKMITTGRVSSPEAFASSGQVTGQVTLCEPDELESRAVAWLNNNQGKMNRNYDPDYKEPGEKSIEELRTILNKARFRFTISPHRPYLLAAINSLENSLDLGFEEAVKKDIDLFVPLFQTPNTRNKIDFFFLSQSRAPKLAKTGKAKPRDVKSIAIIGGGLMGRGIAQIAADRGIETIILDLDQDATNAAISSIEGAIDGLVAKGKWSESRKTDLMSNIRGVTDYGELKDIPLIIECVFEDPELKRRIKAMVEEVNPEAIFASNTSTIPMEQIARDSTRPENLVGMHFFSPVPLMPLLEVVQGKQTSAEALATAVDLGRSIGKTVIIVGDGPGFYTSRTFGTYITNGIRIMELGVVPWDLDMMALQMGFPQGPAHIYGTTGGKVIFHANSLMEDHFPDRLIMPKSLKRLHDAGYVGGDRPSFYSDPAKMTPDKSVMDHIALESGMPTPTREEAQDILTLGMVNEAFFCLEQGVLRDYYSMDLGAVLGIGFPDCWHGPARYAGHRGVKEVKERLEQMCEKFGIEQLRPCEEFSRLIACGVDRGLI